MVLFPCAIPAHPDGSIFDPSRELDVEVRTESRQMNGREVYWEKRGRVVAVIDESLSGTRASSEKTAVYIAQLKTQSWIELHEVAEKQLVDTAAAKFADFLVVGGSGAQNDALPYGCAVVTPESLLHHVCLLARVRGLRLPWDHDLARFGAYGTDRYFWLARAQLPGLASWSYWAQNSTSPPSIYTPRHAGDRMWMDYLRFSDPAFDRTSRLLRSACGQWAKALKATDVVLANHCLPRGAGRRASAGELVLEPLETFLSAAVSCFDATAVAVECVLRTGTDERAVGWQKTRWLKSVSAQLESDSTFGDDFLPNDTTAFADLRYLRNKLHGERLNLYDQRGDRLWHRSGLEHLEAHLTVDEDSPTGYLRPGSLYDIRAISAHFVVKLGQILNRLLNAPVVATLAGRSVYEVHLTAHLSTLVEALQPEIPWPLGDWA